MITVTPNAVSHLKILFGLYNSHIRLALRSGGCAGYSYSWSLDSPTQDDSVISEYLLVDKTTAALLGTVRIDWVEDTFESGWVVSSDALSSCGCGTSVSLGGVHG